jgi:hypothetical protein
MKNEKCSDPKHQSIKFLYFSQDLGTLPINFDTRAEKFAGQKRNREYLFIFNI